MARLIVRSTYSLDVDTVQRLERLAERWSTSKSGALRRAIRVASEHTRTTSNEKVAALKQLQQRLALDAEGVEEWCKAVERERRGAAKHRMDRLLR